MNNFKVGQEIETIKYTDNKDIVKVRVVGDVRRNQVKFEGLQGWWTFRDSAMTNRKLFYKSHNQLEIVE